MFCLSVFTLSVKTALNTLKLKSVSVHKNDGDAAAVKSAVVLQLIRSRYSEYYINIILNTVKLASALNIHSKALFFIIITLRGIRWGPQLNGGAGGLDTCVHDYDNLGTHHLLIISDKFKSQ